MPLLTLAVYILIGALIFYLVIYHLAPRLPHPLGTIVIIVFVVLAILWLLSFITPLPGLSAVRVG
jgi:hypothetical protein